jgi:alpha-L-fucosidase
VVWFDWWIEQIVFEPYLQKFASYYYNKGLEWGLGVAINYKNRAFPEEAAVWDVERGQLKDIRPLFWQTDTSISKNSWGYVQEQDYKTPASLVCDLVDIVSKNGALLLNIGPRPDGTVPEPEQAILLEIGKWLKVNGDAVYGTRPWVIYGEGPTQVEEGSFTDTHRAAFTAQDLRFTCKGNAVYAIVLSRPQGTVSIHSMRAGSAMQADKISRIELLGQGEALSWRQDKAALQVDLPGELPSQPAYALKILMKEA